ncbi:MAG TPA: pyrroline-5-carboxylate reductase [Burkholderiales bacterium]|nr:pyrroline-5-carboxylate reductase [Burkholderiales bacterium]
MKIAFVGGGNMASALIGGLLQKGHAAEDISVLEVDPGARERLAARFGVQSQAAPGTEIAGNDVILLAVKPQQLRAVADSLRPLLGSQLFLTIAAGVRTADLSRWLGGYPRIVRVMPNTPALVLAGVSALYARPSVTAEERRLAEGILSAVGSTLWVEREELMDAVTAVSGSGPAYVFYFIEALEQAGRELGLAPAEARRLSVDTFVGAARLARESGEEPAILRARVTSKGGTTERALQSMEESSVKPLIVEAVRQAAERCRELGDELGQG